MKINYCNPINIYIMLQFIIGYHDPVAHFYDLHVLERYSPFSFNIHTNPCILYAPDQPSARIKCEYAIANDHDFWRGHLIS